jgi:hemerythrin-like domain-containing protein
MSYETLKQASDNELSEMADMLADIVAKIERYAHCENLALWQKVSKQMSSADAKVTEELERREEENYG